MPPSYFQWAQLSTYTYSPSPESTPYYVSEIPCGGCVFKWMTSIGQTHTENLHDGSKFTATWSDRVISPLAIGGSPFDPPVPLTKPLTKCTEYPIWQPPYAKPYHGDCKNSPADLSGVAASIKVTDFSLGGETDSIKLTP
jgi:hypothetical protein